MNLGSGGCSEPRTHHCTPAWVTEQDSVSQKIKRKKEKETEGREAGHSYKVKDKFLGNLLIDSLKPDFVFKKI